MYLASLFQSAATLRFPCSSLTAVHTFAAEPTLKVKPPKCSMQMWWEGTRPYSWVITVDTCIGCNFILIICFYSCPFVFSITEERTWLLSLKDTCHLHNSRSPSVVDFAGAPLPSWAHWTVWGLWLVLAKEIQAEGSISFSQVTFTSPKQPILTFKEWLRLPSYVFYALLI